MGRVGKVRESEGWVVAQVRTVKDLHGSILQAIERNTNTHFLDLQERHLKIKTQKWPGRSGFIWWVRGIFGEPSDKKTQGDKRPFNNPQLVLLGIARTLFPSFFLLFIDL